jgi:hypothetical protein
MLMVAQEEEWQLYAPEKEIPIMPGLPSKIPGIWAKDNPPRPAWSIPPMVVELKPGAIPGSQRSYYIPYKVQVGIQNHLDRLLSMRCFGLVKLPGTLPFCLIKNKGLKILGQFRTSVQSTQQLLLYTLQPQTIYALGPFPS